MIVRHEQRQARIRGKSDIVFVDVTVIAPAAALRRAGLGLLLTASRCCQQASATEQRR